jgi:WD40 repeat protein
MSKSPETPSNEGPSWELDREDEGAKPKAATKKTAKVKPKPEPGSDPEPQPAPEDTPPAAEPPAPPPQPEPARRNWLNDFGTTLRDRFAASQQAIAAIPRPVALAAAAILIVPAVLGFLAASYIGGTQQKLGIRLIGPDGLPDTVTALSWGNGADPVLYVGTQSGELLTLDRAANLRGQSTIGPSILIRPPIVGIATEAGGPVLPVSLAKEQLSATPSGSLAQASGFSNETCRSGYVWREATVDDLVCVPPAIRDQALADRAEAEAGRNTVAGCANGLVPRSANPNDTACTTPEIAATIIADNQRSESRKLLPGSAFAGTRRVELSVATRAVPAERGLFAVSGTSLITGERVTTALEGDSSTKQAVAPAQPVDTIRLAQWTLADIVPARASEVGTLEDVRVLAPQPGTDMVYAGDGTGTLYEIDASVQMSGTNPDAYLRQLGTQGSPITAIAVASAPAEGRPSLVTAAEDGSINAWWPDLPAPSRALEPPALSRPVMSRGSTWALDSQTTFAALTILVKTASHGDALLFSSETSLGMLAAPSIEEAPLPSGAERLLPPFAATPDGRWSAGHDPEAGVIVYEGIIRRPLRSIPITDTPRDIALSPSGDRIAIVRADGSAEIVNLLGDADIELDLPAEALSVAFNPNGTQLAVGLRGIAAALYRADDGVRLDVIGSPVTSGVQTDAAPADKQVRYAPNGRQLVLLDFGRMVSTYGLRMRLESALLNIAVGEELSEGRLTANGQRVVARRGTDELVVYDTRTRTALGSIVSPGFSTWAASPDASIIAVTSAGGSVDIYVEQPDDSVVIPPPRLARDGLKLSADGSALLVRDIEGKLHVWDLSDQAQAKPVLTNLAPDLTAVAAELAPNGRFVVVADSAGGMVLIDLQGGLHRIGIAGHGSLVQHMLLSADGRLLASASLDGVVQITDLARTREVGALPLVTTPIGRRPDRLQPTQLANQPESVSTVLQQFLNDAGYGPVPVDGVFGLATRAAIARLQLERGRPPTGLPDETLLNEATPAQQSAN